MILKYINWIKLIFNLLFNNKESLVIDNHSVDYFLDINSDKLKRNAYNFNFLVNSHQEILIILIKLKLLDKFTMNKNYITKSGKVFTNFQLNSILMNLNNNFCYVFFILFNKHIFINLFNARLNEKQYDTIVYNINSQDRTIYKLIIDNDPFLVEMFCNHQQKFSQYKYMTNYHVNDLIHGSRFISNDIINKLITLDINNYPKLIELRYLNMSLLFDEINDFETTQYNDLFHIDFFITYLQYKQSFGNKTSLTNVLWDIIFVQNDIFYPSYLYRIYHSLKVFNRHEIKNPFFHNLYKNQIDENVLIQIFNTNTDVGMAFLIGYEHTPWFILINIERHYSQKKEYYRMIKDHPNFNKTAKGILDRIKSSNA